MLYRFITPVGYGDVVQIIVNATDLHEAFAKFMRHPKRPREGSFGVWSRGRLVAEVGSRWAPVAGGVEFQCRRFEPERSGGVAVRPSEN